MNIRSYIAEFIGTAVLVLFGCGAAVTANGLLAALGMGLPLAFSTLLIAIAFGLCIVAMAYSIGNVSGCHINPAVSTAMLLTGRMTVKDFVGYVIAQFAGATAGALLLAYFMGSRQALGTNGYGDASALGTKAPVAVAVEIVLTFVFVLVILEVTSKEENASVAGLVIGLTLTLIHILGIPFTGTSVNPARSFGPALIAGGDALKQLPVFILAPLIGGVLAALFYAYILSDDSPLAAKETAAEAADAEEAEVTEPEETAEESAAEAVIEGPSEEAAEEAEAQAVEEADGNASVE